MFELILIVKICKKKSKFIKILNKGIKKGQVELIIVNPDSIGYNDLMNKLLDVENKDIPLRNEKLFIMLTGRNENSEAVWNQGNFLRDTDKIKKAKNILDEKLLEKYNEMRKTSGIHIYRGGADKRNTRSGRLLWKI